jgi:hypothetical protein
MWPRLDTVLPWPHMGLGCCTAEGWQPVVRAHGLASKGADGHVVFATDEAPEAAAERGWRAGVGCAAERGRPVQILDSLRLG